MIPRRLFTAAHEDFRQTVRRFLAEEVVPEHARWEAQGQVDRQMWRRAGELGLLCLTIPEVYGGAGADRLHCAVVMEELAYARASGLNFLSYTEVLATYLLKFGTEDQRRHWLPKMARGEVVCCIAMTEPGTGSDLQAIITRAVHDGDDYVIDGAKTFISNGVLGELYVVAVKTRNDQRQRDEISLVLVEAGRAGFSKGRPLKKVGLAAQDLCELHFQAVRVPRSHLLGVDEGRGLGMLMQELGWERLMIAISAVASARIALQDTVAYARQRRAFGQALIDFQSSRFQLAELKSQIEIAQVFVDRCLQAYMDRQLAPEAAATAKYWTTELLGRVTDVCLQLHGGYGYMAQTAVAQDFLGARVARIYAGTNEIMRELVGRSL